MPNQAQRLKPPGMLLFREVHHRAVSATTTISFWKVVVLATLTTIMPHFSVSQLASLPGYASCLGDQ